MVIFYRKSDSFLPPWTSSRRSEGNGSLFLRFEASLFIIAKGRAHIIICTPRMGRDQARHAAADVIGCEISIHAPRMGRDPGPAKDRPDLHRISIHAPRMGRDRDIPLFYLLFCIFQSTRPVWGATGRGAGLPDYDRDFNPRAPYGARLPPSQSTTAPGPISIHAPRMGRDVRRCGNRHRCRYFNPRARMGRDVSPTFSGEYLVHFNPRAPYGARPGRAWQCAECRNISIHAPRMGRDRVPRAGDAADHYFNPRAPYGARPRLSARAQSQQNISIHAPRMGRDKIVSRGGAREGHFNPRAPYGARRQFGSGPM